MFKPVTEISEEEILAGSETVGYDAPQQFGPLRHWDTEMRCASRGCGSSTFFKVHGIPRCMIHALRELNELCISLGVTE